MLNFLFHKRFNLLESTVIAMLAIAISDGQWLYALGVVLVGSLVVILLEYFLVGRRDRGWKALADRGQKIAAIKEYRTVYGSTLKQALTAVDKYMGIGEDDP